LILKKQGAASTVPCFAEAVISENRLPDPPKKVPIF
jgi:hypothetical protein